MMIPAWWRWYVPPATFASALLFFHASEFLLARHFNPDLLSARSALVSRPYVLAMLCGLAEYAMGLWWLGPERKAASGAAVASYAAGVLLVAGGEALRKAAICGAGRAFTHDIQRERRVDQVCTRGVYAVVRHPGYLGWMLWAVGTMVLLANPVSAAAFFFAARRFFAARIPHEEALLRAMYGEAYAAYARRTPTWMPGIP